MPLLFILPLVAILSGCSLKKMALRSAAPIFEDSSQVMMMEGNWDFFRQSSPGNLKFMEVLWYQDNENLRLLSALVKSYAGYSFAVSETLALEDDLSGVEDSKWKKEAIQFYTRSFDYGLSYLKRKNITSLDLLSNDEEKLIKKLKNLEETDLTALLYTAQSWGSLINLQKDNVALVTQVSKVKIMFDRVCELSPNIDGNICDIFYAQYESSRPRMLGGNPEKGEKLFRESMERNPHNLLLRMSYLQFVVLPAMDIQRYEKESVVLKEEFLKWEDMNRDYLENRSPYRDHQELNLFNSIAKKRFLLLEKYKNKIF